LHRHKQTKGLTTNQIKELNAAWMHAARLKLPLNLLLSFRPADIDATPEPERCRIFAAIRNKLGVHARQHSFPPVFIWTREISRNQDRWLLLIHQIPAKPIRPGGPGLVQYGAGRGL
jgi:hypothetical protein